MKTSFYRFWQFRIDCDALEHGVLADLQLLCSTVSQKQVGSPRPIHIAEDTSTSALYSNRSYRKYLEDRYTF